MMTNRKIFMTAEIIKKNHSYGVKWAGNKVYYYINDIEVTEEEWKTELKENDDGRERPVKIRDGS